MIKETEKVLNYIKEHPECTRSEIQFGLNFSLDDTNHFIRILEINGKIRSKKFEFPNKFVVI